MAFEQKTWKDRVAEYINRRILTKEDGTTELVSVERSEGTISQEGDAFSAENMNDLEQRIANEFSEQNKNISNINTLLHSSHSLISTKVVADVSISTINTRQNIPLVQSENYGDVFSVSDGKIIINKACLIEISGCLYIQANSTSYSNNIVNAYLYVNDNQTSRDITQHNAQIDTYHTCDLSPNILKVNVGDKIALSVMTQTIPIKVCASQTLSRVMAHVIKIL